MAGHGLLPFRAQGTGVAVAEGRDRDGWRDRNQRVDLSTSGGRRAAALVRDRRATLEPPSLEGPDFRVASRIVEAGSGYKGTGAVDTAVRPLIASAASSDRTVRGLQAARCWGRLHRPSSKPAGKVQDPGDCAWSKSRVPSDPRKRARGAWPRHARESAHETAARARGGDGDGPPLGDARGSGAARGHTDGGRRHVRQ